VQPELKVKVNVAKWRFVIFNVSCSPWFTLFVACRECKSSFLASPGLAFTGNYKLLRSPWKYAHPSTARLIAKEEEKA